MKYAIIYTLFFTLLISCDKRYDKPAPPGDDPPPIPSKLTRISSINGNTFAYDSLGRLTRASYSNSITARTDYTYTDSTVTGKDFDLLGNPHGGGIVYYLGTDGIATSEKYTVDSTVPSFLLKFTYNSAKQLIGETVSQMGDAAYLRVTYYYSRGNMDSLRSWSIPDNTLVSVERYEYYTDQPNLLNNETHGVAFIGAGNANLLKKATRVDSGTTTVLEYTYEYDAVQRPIKLHETVDGAASSDLTYTYLK